MGNATINMELTPREALIIETIRSIASYNDVVKTDVQKGDELMQKYLNMDDNEFMVYFRQCFGDETVVDGISESMAIDDMMEHVAQWIDEEQAQELFNRYVPEDVMNDVFIELNGKENLVERLVDMIVDGDWNHENQ
jgi:hypothetical protein